MESPIKNIKDLDRLIAEAREKAKNEAVIKKASSIELAVKPENDTAKLSAIRTYSYDANEAIKRENASIARIKLAEEKSGRIKNYATTNSYFWIILILFLLIGVGAGTYFLISKREPKTEAEPVFVKPTTIISYDNYVSSQIENLEQNIIEVRAGISFIDLKASQGNIIKRLVPEIISTMPNVLERNLSSDFMIGTIEKNAISNPFIILKAPYSYAFVGMTQWEATLQDSVTNIFGNTTKETFKDIWTEKGTSRGNDEISYLITKEGYIIISTDISISEEIYSKI